MKLRVVIVAGVILASVMSYYFTLMAVDHVRSRSTRWMNVGQADAEYRQEASILELPGGTAWPASPEPRTGPDGGPQLYEGGSGRNDADQYWLCSWATKFVVDTDPAMRDEDLKRTEQLVHMPLYKDGFDATTKHNFNDMMKAVSGGTRLL